MRNIKNRESGELMLESMIVVIITMLMLVWILGVGFIYYQKYVVRIATNELANKVAVTYYAPNSDIIMGYVSANEVSGRPIYFTGVDLEKNEGRADSYMNYIVEKANLYGTVEKVDVNVDHIEDAANRSHVKVTTQCTFNTPFGAALEFFGMSGTTTYQVTSYAESTNIQGHLSTIMTNKAFASGAIVEAPGCIKSTIDMINSFIEAGKQLTK